MTLFKQHFRIEWRSLLVWSLIMGLTEVFLILMGVSMQESGALDGMVEMIASLPPALQELYGGAVDLTTMPGWIAAYSFGGWLHVPLLIFTGMYVTGIVTREMDRRTIEFLLAQPVTRGQVIVARWFSLAAALLLLNLTMSIGVILGVLMSGNTPDSAAYLIAGMNGALLYLAIGSVLLAVTVFVDDYGTGLAVVLGGGVGSYILHAIGADAANFLGNLRKALPYELYTPSAILGQGQFPAGDMAILALIAAAGLGLSVWLFQRKQITV